MEPVPEHALDRLGSRRLREILEADPELGWTDPQVRSIWPNAIVTSWVDGEILRR
jgi:hypothetical protein